jgi:hypothetical protein
MCKLGELLLDKSDVSVVLHAVATSSDFDVKLTALIDVCSLISSLSEKGV